MDVLSAIHTAVSNHGEQPVGYASFVASRTTSRWVGPRNLQHRGSGSSKHGEV